MDAHSPDKEGLRRGVQKAGPQEWPQSLYLAAVMLAAFALRMVVGLLVFRTVSAPTLDHNEFGWEMGWTARSIFLGQGFSSPFFPATGPTALVPPLYPYLLAAVFKGFGLYSAKAALAVLGLNSLFSSLTMVPIYFTAKHALHARAAKLTALAWAIYPLSIYFAADRVWDYALTSLLLCLCFWAAQKLHLRSPWAWLGSGLLFGFAALSNPSVLVVLVCLAGLAVFKVYRVRGPWTVNGLVAVLAFVSVCAPWAVRNYRVLHQNAFIRDGFWLEFWAGNNGDTFESNPRWAHPASNAAEMHLYKSAGEMAYMAQKRALALHFVERHPGFFAEVSLRRVFRFWTGFWSLDRRYVRLEPTDIPNLFFCGFLTMLMLRGARRWWKQDRQAAFPYLLTIAIFPVPYYLTHSSMDYRQPIEPVIMLLVTVGIFGVEGQAEQPSATMLEGAFHHVAEHAVAAGKAALTP